MPTSIIWFERLMYGVLIAGLTGVLLYASRAEQPPETGVVIVLVVLAAAVVAGFAALIGLVARRRANWARFVLCALYVLALPHFVRQTLITLPAYPLEDFLAWAQLVAWGAACLLVFSQNARPWFAAPD